MMKNSPLLKWTNNKNNKNKNANKNWIHPPEALQSGHIVYLVKFLGSTEVSQSKGIEVVKEAITKLRFTQQIKKTEGTKTPKVELTISVDGVAIQQPKTKKILSQYPLHQISYCADDKAEKRFFSFISKEADREAHTCFVFVSDKLAEEITLTIGQAFDLAYRRFLDTSNREGELRRQLSSLQQQLESAQQQNALLKDRLTSVASLKDRQDLDRFMEQNGINDILLVNGVQSIEEPIIHSSNSSSNQDISPTINLPPVPPRNSLKPDVAEEQETSEDDFDFDPRAEEKKKTSSSSHPTGDLTNGNDGMGNGSTSPESNGFTSDDDFDPRAEESNKKFFGREKSFEIKSPPPLDLNGIGNFPALVPPPRPSRQQDKLIPNNLLEGSNVPFSSPPPAGDLLTQFDQMQVGFSRGLSFGTADNDFTLESLDPLKN